MADLTFTIEFSSNGEPVLKQISRSAAETGTAIDAAFKKASGPLASAEKGAQSLQKAHESLSGVSRPLKAGLVEVFHQIDLEGPAAKVAAFATLHMSEGFSLMTGAAFGAALGIGAVVNALQSVSAAKKQIEAAFDPKNLAETGKEVDALRERVAGLGSIGGRLEGFVDAPLRTVGDLISRSLGFESASEKELAALETGRQRAIAVTVGLMADKARAANAAVLAELAGKPLVAIEIEKAQAVREVVAALNALGIKGKEARDVIAEVNRGFDLKALKTEVEGLKGITQDIDIEFKDLSRLVTEGLSQRFKMDASLFSESMQSALVDLSETINPLRHQLLSLLGPGKFSAAGLSDIQVAADQTVKAFLQKFGFLPPAIKAEFDSLFSQIKDIAAGTRVALPLETSEAQAKIDALRDQIRRLDLEASGVTVGVDTNDADQELDALEKRLADLKGRPLQGRGNAPLGGTPTRGIPAGMTLESFLEFGLSQVVPGRTLASIQEFGVPIAFRPQIVESPPVPFSRWLEQIAPAKIDEFADQVAGTTLQFNTEFSKAIVENIKSIIDARSQIAQIEANRIGLYPGFGEGLQARAQESEQILGLLLRLGAVSASPIESGGGGGGGGVARGGGDNNITINIGTLTRDTLDRDLLPKFESLLRKVTGKDVTFSVM